MISNLIKYGYDGVQISKSDWMLDDDIRKKIEMRNVSGSEFKEKLMGVLKPKEKVMRMLMPKKNLKNINIDKIGGDKLNPR